MPGVTTDVHFCEFASRIGTLEARDGDYTDKVFDCVENALTVAIAAPGRGFELEPDANPELVHSVSPKPMSDVFCAHGYHLDILTNLVMVVAGSRPSSKGIFAQFWDSRSGICRRRLQLPGEPS